MDLNRSCYTQDMKRIIIGCFAVLLLFSCQESEKETEPRDIPKDDYGWNLVAETCDGIDCKVYIKHEYDFIPVDSGAQLTDVMFRVSITGEKTLGDSVLEAEIKAFLWNLTGRKGDGDMPFDIIYKKERCQGIRFFSNNDILGKKAGEDLSELFSFYVGRGALMYSSFIISEENKWIGGIYDKMSIEEYLSYHPFLFKQASFIMTEPIEGPFEDLSVTIEIELDGGKILRSILCS